ncbi:hypothetical protein ACXX82_05110 [Glaciimonas sp. GNP009]
MAKILKIALLWRVMIALPTQGFASAMMIGCGSSHHHTAEVASTGGDHATSQQSDHFDSDHGVTGSDGFLSKANGKQSSFSKCGTCAGCCLGTAAFLPSMATFNVPTAIGSALRIPSEKRFTVIFPDGLERPPHLLFI